MDIHDVVLILGNCVAAVCTDMAITAIRVLLSGEFVDWPFSTVSFRVGRLLDPVNGWVGLSCVA